MEHVEMRTNNERGQSMVITVVFMVVLLGFAALVIDVGSWYRAHRSAQSTADAAALAGAQVLPDTQNATALAQQYVTKNSSGGSGPGTGGTTPQITITQQGYEPDTITVKVSRPSPGFFAKVFGSAFGSVNVSGTATARAYNVYGVRNGIAPITVNYKHPLLNCTRGQQPTCNPTYGTPTTLGLQDIHTSGGKDAAGAFGLINLNGVDNGNIGAGTLADWLLNGYQDHDLTTGHYDSAPSSNFNNSQFTDALNQMIGQELLFPVYRLIQGPGSNAMYDIIGWVGFVITSYDTSGSTGTITGYFTRYTTDGVPAENGGGGAQGLGVHRIELTN
jgi:Flp pilus assembly protein TadG